MTAYTPATSAPPFSGFDVPRQNYFKLPNNWTDITAAIGSIAELKVVEYVLRHTWGYQEYGISKSISLTEFMYGRRRSDGSRMDVGTGLSKPSVIAGLKSAIARGLLLEETDDADKARIKKFYRLRMVEDASGNAVSERIEAVLEGDLAPEERGVKELNAEVKDLYRGVQTFYPGGKSSLPRTEKDTLERNLVERKDSNNNNTAPAGAAADTPTKAVVVASLVQHGIGRSVAQTLAGNFTPARIAEKIEYLEFLLAERPEDVQKPAAWLRRAIERDFGAPDGFVTASAREQAAQQEKERLEALAEAQNAHAARERQLQKEQDARRAAERARLRAEYATNPEEEALWTRLLESVEMAGDNALYGLLAHTQLLSASDEMLTVAVPAGIHATQLESARMEAHIQRVLKRLTQKEYGLHFVPFEGLA